MVLFPRNKEGVPNFIIVILEYNAVANGTMDCAVL